MRVPTLPNSAVARAVPAVRRVPREEWPRSIRPRLKKLRARGSAVAVVEMGGATLILALPTEHALDARIASLAREARAS